MFILFSLQFSLLCEILALFYLLELSYNNTSYLLILLLSVISIILSLFYYYLLFLYNNILIIIDIHIIAIKTIIIGIYILFEVLLY